MSVGKIYGRKAKQLLTKHGYSASGYAGIPTGIFVLIGAIQKFDPAHACIAILGTCVATNAAQRAIWGKPDKQTYGASVNADIGLTAASATAYGIGGIMLGKPFIILAAGMYLSRAGFLYSAAHGEDSKKDCAQQGDISMKRASTAGLAGAFASGVGMLQTLPTLWATLGIAMMTINYGAPYFAPSPKKNSVETI